MAVRSKRKAKKIRRHRKGARGTNVTQRVDVRVHVGKRGNEQVHQKSRHEGVVPKVLTMPLTLPTPPPPPKFTDVPSEFMYSNTRPGNTVRAPDTEMLNQPTLTIAQPLSDFEQVKRGLIRSKVRYKRVAKPGEVYINCPECGRRMYESTLPAHNAEYHPETKSFETPLKNPY